MVVTLCILKSARAKLVSDFKSKKQDIYLPMFKYENFPVLMNLALDSYFTSWINHHFRLLDECSDFKQENVFFQTVRMLAKKILSCIVEIDDYNKGFVSKLLISKIDLLDKIIKTGEKDDEKYKALLMEYEKDKALFNREINQIKGGQ